jgi:hypothetical protein
VYRVPLTLHNALERGESPVIYAVIDTHMGKRVYAGKELTCTISSALEQSARVLSFGTFERTLIPRKDDVLTAYSGKQVQHISIQLDNADRYFSRLIAKEPFLSRPISVYVGFEADAATGHISLFTGTITELSYMAVMTIEADER